MIVSNKRFGNYGSNKIRRQMAAFINPFVLWAVDNTYLYLD